MGSLIGGILILVLFAGPARAGDLPKTLTLALTPSQSPTALQETGEAFAKAISQRLGTPVKAVVASDYAAVIEALRNRTADLAFLHTAGYVLAHREAWARLVVQDIWHGRTSYTSRIYVRKESGLKTLEDLRGKTIAFVDPTSTSGYIYPMVLLMKRGLVKDKDPKTFFREAIFAGQHDAAFLALLNGTVDAAASFDLAREQYLKDRERIEKISWVVETPPIPEAGICVRQGLDPDLVKRIQQALLAMNGPEYKALYKKLYDIDGFGPPPDDTVFDPVRDAWSMMPEAFTKKK